MVGLLSEGLLLFLHYNSGQCRFIVIKTIFNNLELKIIKEKTVNLNKFKLIGASNKQNWCGKYFISWNSKFKTLQT